MWAHLVQAWQKLWRIQYLYQFLTLILYPLSHLPNSWTGVLNDEKGLIDILDISKSLSKFLSQGSKMGLERSSTSLLEVFSLVSKSIMVRGSNKNKQTKKAWLFFKTVCIAYVLGFPCLSSSSASNSSQVYTHIPASLTSLELNLLTQSHTQQYHLMSSEHLRPPGFKLISWF